MDQKEHIELLIKNSKEQTDRAGKIQTAYRLYCEEKSDSSFSKLITLLDAYCLSWVRKELWKTDCYTEENEHSILQESRLAVWNYISKDCRDNILRETFAYYAFGIYKNKTLDVIRKISRKRAKWGEDESLDKTIGENEKTLGDSLPSKEFDGEKNQEVRKMYEMLFHTYCMTFMGSTTFPPRSLALFYARVLPHLLHINHNIDTIPDTKATSAKWAFEKMGDSTVDQLKENSEKLLQREVSKDLIWCEEFVNQLEKTIDIESRKVILRDVIYTSVYDKGKIEDWADYMHKATTKAAINFVLNNHELLSLVKEYVSQKDILYRFVEGGERR